MHIPDGYLGPKTYGFFYILMLPLWTIGSRVVSRTLKGRYIPYTAVSAAFSFVIMMFNIPVPGGTTGHVVGSVLIALLFNPWTALLVMSVVLFVQAIVFGDGGITIFAANCFNMGFIMPFAGFYTYKLLTIKTGINSKRRWAGALIAGYTGINIAALFAGIELGLQPLLEHAADGKPLYFPFSIRIAVPAMMIGHLTIFGIAEAVITLAGVLYTQRYDPVNIEGYRS